MRHAHNKIFFSNVIAVTDVHAFISYYSFHETFGVIPVISCSLNPYPFRIGKIFFHDSHNR